MRQLDGITDAMDMNLGKLWEMVRDRKVRHAAVMWSQRVGHEWATEPQQQFKYTHVHTHKHTYTRISFWLYFSG